MTISTIRVLRGVWVGAIIGTVLTVMGGIASAQEAAPSFFEEADKATSDCYARCDAQPAATATAKAEVVVTKAAPAPRAHKRAKRSGARATATARASVTQFSDLEGRVSALEGRADGHDGDIAAIREELANLKVSATATATADGSGDDDHAAILAALRQLDERIGKMEIERRPAFGNSVGVSAGALALRGSEKLTFASTFVAARLNIGLNEKFYLFVEPSLLVAFGDHPFGAGIGGGIGYQVYRSGEYAGALEFGAQGTAMAIQNDLNAKAIASLATAGISMRLPHDFRVGGKVLVGPSFAADRDPGLAIGGAVNIGYDFR